ncbi:unnamed protein product [Arabidopsis lyrata]|uniref:non-specific serine/threonine protein kinase n=1 Tax=Arabidopsis lyrata subsp. lyrata TaxID=81972 RepID=D7MY69_ARALL|nr:hypothetical protein ARALYDRAFT_359733 [Arabidopsis lyrata subsp. lyrata]CAH8273546.1 unnamed protein product [Arabidopsis lyrata]
MICHMCERDSFVDGGDGFFYCLQCCTRLEGIIQTAGVDGRELYRKQNTRPKPRPKFVNLVPSETTSYSGSGYVGPEVSHLGWGRWYTLRELEAATNGLCEENVIGEGGYGIVYSGILTDGTKVAVKNLLNNRIDPLLVFG